MTNVKDLIQHQILALQRRKQGLPPPPDLPSLSKKRSKAASKKQKRKRSNKTKHIPDSKQKRRLRRRGIFIGKHVIENVKDTENAKSVSVDFKNNNHNNLNNPPSKAAIQPINKSSSYIKSRVDYLKGLKKQDVLVGRGTAAKYGSRVQVTYIGSLVQSGLVFDSCKSQLKPFQFTIGHEEVIEGFEEGVIGMKLGGNRIVIVPPHLGYGMNHSEFKKIPPKSTLQFDITLVGFY